ncbi:MAG TPA: sigma-54 dependent transcriptional regulator [Kofleriaceae bacterium]|nr:sigma-54 dependent transcriptional regulator [Kofleriaceae bacterium]
MSRILVIDDDGTARSMATTTLRGHGHDVVAVDSSQAIGLLTETAFDLVVTATTSDASELRDRVAAPVELVRLRPPVTERDLVVIVDQHEQRATTHETFAHARRALTEDLDPALPIIGRSPAIELVLARLSAIAVTNAPVLLTGESGTGKELLAHLIHERSSRRNEALVIVNCAAFPETLIEAELFGHERGAFTGAMQKRDGKFKAAQGGTLFLDEINGLSLAAQAKLLRVLQDGRIQPLGTNAEIVVDVRLISATNRELSAMVADGSFRGDLYYRIKVLDLDVPPLRERTGDLPLLVEHFLQKHAQPGRRPTLSPRAWAMVSTYSFPGNVRELEHAIQRAIVLAGGCEIDLEHLPREIVPTLKAIPPSREREIKPLADALHAFEREYLRHALEATQGNKTQAARLLGISRKHLWEKLRQLAALESNHRHGA